MNRLLAATLLPIALLALSACQKQEESGGAPVVRPVLSLIAGPRPHSLLGFAGTIQPQIQTNLSFRLIGRLIARDVNVGDLVAKGQRLAAIDPTALELAMRSAAADLSSAKAQAINAMASAGRQRALRETDAASQSVLEGADQALIAAQANVLRAESAVSKAREQLSYAQIQAEFDAVVTASLAEIGQTVSAGQTVVTIARPDLRDAVVDLPLDTGNVTIGTSFTVALQIDPETKITGKVREIAPQADPTTRTHRVKIALPGDAPSSFRLGTTVTAYLAGDAGDGIELPLSALLEKNGKTTVWIVDETAQTVLGREIRVGLKTERSFTVADGIEPGARVVTAGVHSLSEGQKVKIGEEMLR